MDLISGFFTLMEYSVLYLEISFILSTKYLKKWSQSDFTNVNSDRTVVWNSMQNVIY